MKLPFRSLGAGTADHAGAAEDRRAMEVVWRRPAPPLSELVETLWFAENPEPGHRRERVLPSGSMQLLINLDADRLRYRDGAEHRLPGVAMGGAYSRAIGIDTRDQTAIAGVHFKAGGAAPFLGVPAAELANHHVGGDVLWGPDAGWLRERMLAASEPAAALEELERSLLMLARRPLQRDPSVAFAVTAAADLTVSEVVDRIGTSARTFTRRFAAAVGLTPKRFFRLARFQRALAAASGAARPLTEVAHVCGYYDQAHFIHDFRDFAGLTPTAYRAAASAGYPNHVPDDG